MNGVEAVQVTASPPSMDVMWTTSSGVPGPPIVADGLVWSIGDRTVYGLDPLTGTPVVQFRIGPVANHFPTPSVGDGVLLAASAEKVHAFTLTP